MSKSVASAESTGKTSSYSYSSSKGKQLSLEEHEQMKQERLQRLKEQSKRDKKFTDQLGVQTRQHQLEKAKVMTKGNPLAVDQEAQYNKDITRLRNKYIFKRKA